MQQTLNFNKIVGIVVIVWELDLQLHKQSVSITTIIVR